MTEFLDEQSKHLPVVESVVARVISLKKDLTSAVGDLLLGPEGALSLLAEGFDYLVHPENTLPRDDVKD